MKLLIITNNPTRPSFRQRIEIYQDILRQNDIHCHIRQLPPGMWGRRDLFQSCRDYDCVFLHKKRLNWLNACQLRKNSRKIIYDFDDAVMVSEKRPDQPDASRLKVFRRTVKLADRVLAGNAFLAGQARAYNANVEIVPTGLNVAEYPEDKRPFQLNDGKIRLVWIGSKSTLGYLSMITDSLEEIGRRFPNVVLRIICDEFFDLSNMDVERKPWSLSTQVRDLMECDIGLAPLPDDPFTRGKCGFKILQYAAASLPTVASPVGVNAEMIQDSQAGFLADSPQQWIENVSSLISNAENRVSVGHASRCNVAINYDKTVLGERLCQHIKQTLDFGVT